MKYSVAITAIIGASSVTAVPVTFEKRDLLGSLGSLLPGLGGSSSAPSTSSNPVQDALDSIVAGGPVSDQAIILLQDPSLAQNTQTTIKNAETLVKVKKLMSNQQFLAQTAQLSTNETFINQVAACAGNSPAYTQSAQLAGNTQYLSFLSSIVGDSDIFDAAKSALTESNFDYGAYLVNNTQSPAYWNLASSVAGSDYADVVAKLQALFSDKVFMSRFDALLSSQGNFAVDLNGMLTDTQFVTHVCDVLGLSASLTSQIIAALGTSANFAAGLEGMLGSQWKGQISGIIGTGSASSIVNWAFGGLGSFNAIISGYLSSGTIVSAVGSLLGNSAFSATFTALVNGFLSGSLDLSAIIKKVIGNISFLSLITSALAIPLEIVQSVISTITASGFFNIFFNFFGLTY